MIAPIEIYALSRLLVGGSALPEFMSIPPGPTRTIVDRLGLTPNEGRLEVFEAFVAAREDGPDIALAVAEANPDGPIPDPDDGDPDDGWGPLCQNDLPEVENFPLDVLPLAARVIALEAATSVGCALDFTAAATLVVAAGVIGRSASLRLKEGYFASSSLWLGIVGLPSDAKSPAANAIFEAARRIDEFLRAEHEEEMVAWSPKEPPNDKPPRLSRVDVDDCTMEALIGIMAENERGLLQYNDELSGFIFGMDQYRSGGKGSDRSKCCSIWAGKRIKVDRVSQNGRIPLRVDYPCLSLIGPLVPDNLKAMTGLQNGADGFLDRFLFVDPKQLPVPDWTEDGIDEAAATPWYDLVARLWLRKPVVEGRRSHPHVLYLNGDARDAWRECHRSHVATMNDPDFPAHLRGVYGKLREYAGRLALVLALMHDAADLDSDPESVPVVGPQIIRDAWRLVAYFASHARKAHGRIGSKRPTESSERRMIVEWLRDSSLKAPSFDSFSQSTLTQARKTLRNNPELKPALAGLVKDGLIRLAPEEPGKVRRSPVYLVHPSFGEPK